MGWSCAVCTFGNTNDASSKCEICETERGEALDLVRHERVTEQSKKERTPKISAAAARKPAKATVQSTLFGKIATMKEPPKAQKKPKAEANQRKPKAEITQRKPAKAATTTNQRPPAISAPAMKANVNVNGARRARPAPLLFSQPASGTCVPKNTPFPVLMESAQTKMREIFKIDGLRHLQPAAVECALKRQSQLIIMATGGGKSLCFQLPAVVLGGTTIVVSPLIALMADQSQALLDKGIAAAVISSSNGEGKNLDVMERLLGRSLRAKQKLDPSTLRPVTLLYCTPEQIQTNRFQNILMELHQKNRLALFAIDEAHCLSSWGHDFRPAYRKLGWLRQSFPDVPCMACTATATPKVIQDIRETLRLQDCPCHMGSFDRVNIRYRVRYKDALDQSSERGAKGDLLDFIQREHDRAQRKKTVYSGIVYVHKRSDTTDLAKEITKATGIIAAAYHGGLKVAERERVQQSWTSGETNIAIATVAFGMGIDLAHVRYVVHWSMAKSIEAFYQESGRAGRDGLGSTSVLYFSKSDADKFAYLVNKQKGKKSKNKNDKSATHALEDLQRMIDYCITPGCRRKCLLQHFGERNVDPKTVCKGKCDFCKDPKGVEEAIEAATAENDFTFHTKPKPETKWDGQWESPFGDDDPTSGEVDNDWEVDGLDITGARQFGEENTSNSQHKPSAAAVLSKFENLEDRGFVRFKSKTNGASNNGVSTIIVPEHIRAQLPDPLAHYNSNETAPPIAQESAASLRDQLAKLQAKRDNRAKETQAGSRKRPAPPPPPPIAFGRKKK